MDKRLIVDKELYKEYAIHDTIDLEELNLYFAKKRTNALFFSRKESNKQLAIQQILLDRTKKYLELS